MLQITIPATELVDEKTLRFYSIKEQTLTLEHSLVSLSKWEAKWKKPFLSKKEKTIEEIVDYVKCMTLTKNVDPMVYMCLTEEHIESISSYINDPMTATWFSDDKQHSRNSEQITSELIYYWLIALNIPFECQKWHLNRLLTLVKVCEVKSQPPKKRSSKDIINRNAVLNAARRKQLNTKG